MQKKSIKFTANCPRGNAKTRVLLLTILLAPAFFPNNLLAAEQMNSQPYEYELNQKIRTSLSRAASALIKRLEKSDEDLIIAPYRQRKVSEWKTVDVRYTKKKIDMPVYKKEPYQALALVKNGSATGAGSLQNVTKYRYVQKGTEKQERLFRDPNGSITIQEKRPVYGLGGPDFWPDKFLGQNALALCALLKSGKSTDQPAVGKLADKLNTYLEAYGLPDRTWDVAWLTAAFANLPGEQFDKNTKRLVGKLLNGQLTDGPGTGLWGPVCVNLPLVSKLVRAQQPYNDDLAKISERLKDQPKSKSWKAKKRAASIAKAKLQKALNELTVQCLSFEKSTETREFDAGDYTGYLNNIEVHGMPYNVHSQATADLELTSLANKLDGVNNVYLDVIEHQEKIVFLYRVKDGCANRSYGLQVASLAGIPVPVIEKARAQMTDMKQVPTTGSEPSTQTDLFHKTTALEDFLHTLDVDNITPKQALDALYEMKILMAQDKS